MELLLLVLQISLALLILFLLLIILAELFIVCLPVSAVFAEVTICGGMPSIELLLKSGFTRNLRGARGVPGYLGIMLHISYRPTSLTGLDSIGDYNGGY